MDFDAGGAVLPLLLVTSEKKSCLETFVGGGEGRGVQRRREKLEKFFFGKVGPSLRRRSGVIEFHGGGPCSSVT